MDKNTLSNYGWIVIAVLVLSVMIALATPFGKFVKTGVENTTQGLFETSEKAMNIVCAENSMMTEFESTSCIHANTTREGYKEATCTTDGFTGKLICMNCGKTIAGGLPIRSVGHLIDAETEICQFCGQHIVNS